MAEKDAVDELTDLPKQIGSTLFDLFKAIRDKSLAEKQAQQQAQQAATERQGEMAQQQKFMEEQNKKMLDGFQKALNDKGIQATEKNVKLAKDQIARLDKISDKETGINDKIGKIDGRLGEIDKERQNIMKAASDPTSQPDHAKLFGDLNKLEAEKVGLEKEKAGLHGDLKKLDEERVGIMNGEGLQELERVETPGWQRAENPMGPQKKPMMGTNRGPELTAPLPKQKVEGIPLETPLELAELEEVGPQIVEGDGLEMDAVTLDESELEGVGKQKVDGQLQEPQVEVPSQQQGVVPRTPSSSLVQPKGQMRGGIGVTGGVSLPVPDESLSVAGGKFNLADFREGSTGAQWKSEIQKNGGRRMSAPANMLKNGPKLPRRI